MEKIILLSFLLFLFLVVFYLSYKIIYRFILLNKYKNVLDLFDYFCKKSYDIIYTDQIIGYTSNGIREIPNDEYETIQRNFIKLTLQLMGSNNANMFLNFFGNNESFVTNIIFYIKKQITNDQLTNLLQVQNIEKEKEK